MRVCLCVCVLACMCVSNFISVVFLWSVTWGMDTHNPNTFAALPRQESEAKQDGWTKIADCDSMYLATRKKVFKCISVFFFNLILAKFALSDLDRCIKSLKGIVKV